MSETHPLHIPDRLAARWYRVRAPLLALLGAWAWWPAAGRESAATGSLRPLGVPTSVSEGAGAQPVAGLPLAEWATAWEPQLDPRAYAVSEKFDGVRALWDGKALRFRSGREIPAPAGFLAELPAMALDGELWLGRASFDRLSATVRKAEPADGPWQQVRYMVFDAPLTGLTFRQRYQRLQELLSTRPTPRVVLAEQTPLNDARALAQRLQEVTDQGGEGLVLHHWEALWQPGRSKMVRKLKLQPDEEGRVLALLPGKGQFQGQMGGLLLETPDKKRFTLGTGFSHADRQSPPPVGSTVTFRYRDRTPQGIPRFASFVRVRGDE